MISIKIKKEEFDEFLGEFEQAQRSRIKKIYNIMDLCGTYALRSVQKNLSGGALYRDTGDLYKSIEKSKVYQKGKNVYAIDVGILKNYPHRHHYGSIPTWVYGEAWETGFKYPSIIIRAKYAPLLVFYWEKMGKWVATKSVSIPARKEAARPWFWPGIGESLTRIEKLLNAWIMVDFME